MYFRVVNGGIPETTELLKEKFDYIFYTGSTMVGKIIHKSANENLTPCTLELGGKSPVYIDDNCNLETVVKRLLWGKMVNLGQTCVAPDYVLCSKNTQNKVLSLTKQVMKEWFGDKPIDSPDLGRVISERHFDRLLSLMKNSTGEIVYGNEISQDPNIYMYQKTLYFVI